MTILPNGVAVTGTTHHAQWCATHGLVHDEFTAGVIRYVVEKYGVKTCVDGGANIGTLTKVMLDAGCEVIAFEPNPDAFACLEHNCAGTGLVMVMSALGESEHTTGLTVSDNAGASFCGGAGDIRVAALDTLDLGRLDFLKLDIEGWEFAALNGADKSIRFNRPIMLIEINRCALARQGHTPEMIAGWLNARDYTFTIIQPECTFESEQFDILCVPSEKVVD
tara:strand:- start:335 stop:1000 length:666 start_codon:yes stop_codon:yes gene_type:complete